MLTRRGDKVELKRNRVGVSFKCETEQGENEEEEV